jgi:hypothetical protein
MTLVSARSSRRLAPRICAALALLGSAVPLHAGGNVTVRVDRGGNLLVEGDREANAIEIHPYDIGAGTVTGVGSTLVNGAKSAEFTGASGDFRFWMRGGDDRVVVSDGDGNHVLGDLEVDLGPGNDSLLVQNFFVHDDLEVRGNSGDDTIELADTVFVLGRADIRTSAGDDRVVFRPAAFFDPLVIVFERDFEVRTGPGRDFVHLAGARFQRGVEVNLGHDDDLGELGGVQGGVSVCGCAFDDPDVLSHVRFRGGAGNDGAVLESVCGLAPPGLVQDFLRDFEDFPDDASFLGGEACARSCP